MTKKPKLPTGAQAAARALYMAGEQQKRIAENLAVSEQTISKWVKDGGWERLRAAANITRKELVNKSLEALNRILDQVILSDDVELLTMLPDRLAKFASAIDKLDRSDNIVKRIETFTDFFNWLQAKQSDYPELSNQFLLTLNRFQDLYVHEHI